MQVSPETKQLFEQLARRPEFTSWLDQKETAKTQVLKKNSDLVQLARAQGATELIDEMRELMKRQVNRNPS